MTSVYGFTFLGAREQIKRRFEEKMLITDDKLLFRAACYTAKIAVSALVALGGIFQAARGIMGWLGDCAKIRTSLQILALKREGDTKTGHWYAFCWLVCTIPFGHMHVMLIQ
ncbi:hypothetical protein CASFOL_036537 [Castilleja foliolosa]|uniref:DNA-directed RNA polymerase n=1 Tax=Castilleja foliolosa TaxID=1961234 RepID=A0ABD3BY93_9LAMI